MAYALVPLVRPLHLGLKGRDVTAVQAALRNAKVRTGNPTGHYGPRTKRQVGDFKKKHNIHELGYAHKTHSALWPHFGPVAYKLYKEAYDAKHVYVVAQKVVNVAFFGYDNRFAIHYTEDSRRMTDFAPPPNVPNYTDCSGFCTWCYKSGGASDPNGLGYNGYGFTGTMLMNGHQVPLSGPLYKGDLIFYGHPVQHVAIYVGSGRVISHGNEDGPQLLAMYYWSAINCARRYIPHQ